MLHAEKRQGHAARITQAGSHKRKNPAVAKRQNEPGQDCPAAAIARVNLAGPTVRFPESSEVRRVTIHGNTFCYGPLALRTIAMSQHPPFSPCLRRAARCRDRQGGVPTPARWRLAAAYALTALAVSLGATAMAQTATGASAVEPAPPASGEPLPPPPRTPTSPRRSARRMARPVARLRQHALQPARSDQRRQRGALRVAWTFSDGDAERPRGGAAGRRQHDVPGDAVSEHAYRARPDQARRADQVDVTRRTLADRDRQGVLRHGQPRRRLCQRQDHLQPARHAHRRGRRRRPARRSGARRWATSRTARR